MRVRIFLGLLISLTAAPLWSQVDPDASGGVANPDDEFQMSMPSQVNGRPYPMSFESEQRSNYLSGGFVFTSAYDDNVYDGLNTRSQTSIAIAPTLGIHRDSTRMATSLAYAVGFTLYEPTTALNQFNQNLSANVMFRPSRHTSLSFQDTFQQNSSLLSQPYTSNGVPVSGSIGQTGQLIVPFADQTMNSTSVEFSYQLSRSAMMGGSGGYGLFRYPDLNQVPGLTNSDSANGSGFYVRRMSRNQYLGLIYRYSHTTTSPIETTTNTQVGSVLYTFEPSHIVSLSVTAGPEFYSTQEPGKPGSSSLGSFVLASANVHGTRSSVAGTYSQSVTAGQGLVGAYSSNTFNISARWQLSRVWQAGASGEYMNLSEALPNALTVVTTPGGHTVFGLVSVTRLLGQNLTATADYRRLHQTYEGVAVLNDSGNDDRVSVAISYQFRRLIGR